MLQMEHFAILSTFIKLPFVIKIFDLSIFVWPFYTDFTVITLYNAHMSLLVRKPVFGVSDQVMLKPANSATETS